MTGQKIQEIGTFALGEIPENLEITLKGTDDNPIDLTGFTPKIAIAAIEGIAAANLGGGSIVNKSPETGGIVVYSWHADDFANEGTFRLQIWVSDGTNDIASEVFQYEVESVTTKPSFA